MCKKILVTLGPSSLNERVVTECSNIGIYTFRINLSHTPQDQISETIEKIRMWTDVPICIDSEGAQMRNQTMSFESVNYKSGDEIRVHFNPVWEMRRIYHFRRAESPTSSRRATK